MSSLLQKVERLKRGRWEKKARGKVRRSGRRGCAPHRPSRSGQVSPRRVGISQATVTVTTADIRTQPPHKGVCPRPRARGAKGRFAGRAGTGSTCQLGADFVADTLLWKDFVRALRSVALRVDGLVRLAAGLALGLLAVPEVRALPQSVRGRAEAINRSDAPWSRRCGQQRRPQSQRRPPWPWRCCRVDLQTDSAWVGG